MLFSISSDSLRQEGFANELSAVIQHWRREVKVDLTDRIWLSVLQDQLNDDNFLITLHASRKDSVQFYGTDVREFSWNKLSYNNPPQGMKKLLWLLLAADLLGDKIGIYSTEIFIKEINQGFEVSKNNKARKFLGD